MARRFRVATIIGARPQFLKAAPLSTALRKKMKEILIHTGQHYDWAMSGRFFDELSIPKPDYNLNVGSGTHAEQIGKIMMRLEKILLQLRPDIVVVYGDTNSTLAGALTALKLGIPLAHIEAGMRSFDWTMPEEQNRVITDRISTLLFCPSPAAAKNVRREGITRGVFVSGDNMLDTLFSSLPRARRTSRILKSLHLEHRGYVLLTLHRAANTDSEQQLRSIMNAVVSAAKSVPVVFPVHPRTRAALQRTNILAVLLGNHRIQLLDPVGYLDMLMLMMNARTVITDSGGVQKEAFSLKVPCITLRENTEWAETVEMGWNILVGHSKRKILRALQNPPHPKRHRYIYGKVGASRIIASEILRFLKQKRAKNSRLTERRGRRRIVGRLKTR